MWCISINLLITTQNIGLSPTANILILMLRCLPSPLWRAVCSSDRWDCPTSTLASSLSLHNSPLWGRSPGSTICLSNFYDNFVSRTIPNRQQWEERWKELKSSSGYFIVVIEDVALEKVVGAATLLVEKKFIHECGQVVILWMYLFKYSGRTYSNIVAVLIQI